MSLLQHAFLLVLVMLMLTGLSCGALPKPGDPQDISFCVD